MSIASRQTAVSLWRRFAALPRDTAKLRAFALWGAIGCALGALVGEPLWLWFGPSARPEHRICLVLDCSGSMLGGSVGERRMSKIEEVKLAASNFIDRQDFANTRISVIGFGSDVHIGSPLSADAKRLRRAIDLLDAGGGTNMAAAILQATDELSRETPPSATAPLTSVLLFTDGQPDNQSAALRAAEACRARNARIVAIGAGDADVGMLAQITGDPKLVFPASAGSFGETFRVAENALGRGSLAQSGGGEQGFLKSLVLLVIWTALLAAGVSLALIVGQNFYLRRPALNDRELLIGALGGLLAGGVAGFAGQLLFGLGAAAAAASNLAFVAGAAVFFARLLGWIILGGLAGRGLAFFIPNLAPTSAALGGAAGGFLGAIAFVLASTFGDTLGRLVGSASLGAMIGLMLALAEVVSRRAWLQVYFGPTESVRVNLGSSLVKVGSDSRACSVYAREARPLAFGFRFVDHQVECVDFATEKTSRMRAGDEMEVGVVKVVVRTSAEAATGEGPESPAKTDRRPPPPPPAPPSPRPAARQPLGDPAESSAAPAAPTGANASGPPKPEPRREVKLAPGLKPAAPPPPPPPPRPDPASAAKPAPATSPANAAAPNRVIRPLPPPPAAPK